MITSTCASCVHLTFQYRSKKEEQPRMRTHHPSHGKVRADPMLDPISFHVVERVDASR